MIAVIDACSILNLLLVNYDDRYITHIERAFDEIVISPKVFAEISNHKADNVLDEDLQDSIDTIIYNHINRHVANPDPEKECDFIETSIPYEKKNGEFYAVSHSLSKSRLGKENLLENLWKTHFITDDKPATEEFEYFYRINAVGQILNTIDLMTFLCLKGHIGKGELLRYCESLKLLYSRSASLLLRELKAINDHLTSDFKEQAMVTQLIHIISDLQDDVIKKASDLIEKAEFKKFIRNNRKLQPLIDEFLNSNYREKIPEINKRMKDLGKVWQLDYLTTN